MCVLPRRIYRPANRATVDINPETGAFNGQQVSLGALGDSFYEYLLKLWLLSGKRLNDLKARIPRLPSHLMGL